jgi:hypothetical protein
MCFHALEDCLIEFAHAREISTKDAFPARENHALAFVLAWERKDEAFLHARVSCLMAFMHAPEHNSLAF